MITITHTAQSGTLAEGTSRGDTAGPILKACGWRWGRSIGAWYVPRSRDTRPRRDLITATVAQLQEAGYEVAVEIDDTTRPTAEVEADRRAHAAERAEALAAKAERVRVAADASYTAAHELAERMPLGQPILVGHHSERSMRAAYDKIGRSYDKAFEADNDAQEAERRAEVAAHTSGARYAPHTVANRIDKLAADQRRAERAGRTTAAAELADQVDYWRGVRAQQIADGLAADIRPDQVKPGDFARIGRRWHPVIRVSAKSVTLTYSELPGIPQRLPWHALDAIRSTEEAQQ